MKNIEFGIINNESAKGIGVSALEDGKNIGEAYCYQNRVTGDYAIRGLEVKKSSRNQGVGTLIMKKIIEILQSKKTPYVLVFVEDENIPSQNLMTKLGFEETEKGASDNLDPRIKKFVKNL